MTEHELKTWMPFYEHVSSGQKPFEVRKNDRGYQVGDVLHLREWDQEKAARFCLMDATWFYTGRSHRRTVTYTLTGESWGVKEGFIVLGVGGVL